MSKKTRFFRVFTEGNTVDGRVVERTWIEQIVKNYDTKVYGARVWNEHYRSVMPEGPFGAYGDVLAVKAEEVDGKLTLFAQIDPTDELVALNKKRQKVYTSAEVDIDFAKTGEAYLVGLAITDNPASLSVDMLTFSAEKKENGPLVARKQRPENYFTAAQEFSLELEQEQESILSRVKAMFSRNDEKSGEQLGDVHKAIETIAGEVLQSAVQFKNLNSELTAAQAKVNELETNQETLKQEFSALKEALDNTPNTQRRTPASGGDAAAVVTDC